MDLRQATYTAAAVIAAFTLFTGCAAQEIAAPTETGSEASAEPTPSSTGTLSVEPMRFFDGDCESVITATQRAAVVGPGSVPIDEQRRLWAPDRIEMPDIDALGTLGGVECEWAVGDGVPGLPEGLGSVAVILLPAASVPAEFATSYETAKCEPSYDATNCRMSRLDGDTWIMARAGWSLAEAPTSILDAVIEAAAANVSAATDARRGDAAPTWWTLDGCAALHRDMSLDEVVGPYSDGYWEGSEQPEQKLLSLAGVEQYCPWFSDGEALASDATFYIGGTTLSPGAAWQWKVIASADGMEPITVRGATDAVVFASDSRVYATDGVAIVTISAGDDAAVAAEIASRALGTLG